MFRSVIGACSSFAALALALPRSMASSDRGTPCSSPALHAARRARGDASSDRSSSCSMPAYSRRTARSAALARRLTDRPPKFSNTTSHSHDVPPSATWLLIAISRHPRRGPPSTAPPASRRDSSPAACAPRGRRPSWWSSGPRRCPRPRWRSPTTASAPSSTAAAVASVALPRLASPGSVRSSGIVVPYGSKCPPEIAHAAGSESTATRKLLDRVPVVAVADDGAARARAARRIVGPAAAGGDPHDVLRVPRGRGDQRIIAVRDDRRLRIRVHRIAQRPLDLVDLAHPIQLIPRQVQQTSTAASGPRRCARRAAHRPPGPACPRPATPSAPR